MSGSNGGRSRLVAHEQDVEQELDGGGLDAERRLNQAGGQHMRLAPMDLLG
jgi:hypothetical protein